MKISRVAVTGMGAVCGLGINVAQIWDAALQGQSGVRLIPKDDPVHTKTNFDFPVHIAGKPSHYKISADLLSEKEQPRFDLFNHYALSSAHEALIQANFFPLPYPAHRVGSILGVGMGGFPFIERDHQEFLQQTRPRTSPFFIPSLIPNMATGLISIRFGFTGANFTVASACASSGHAILNAFNLIRLGQQDAILSGGAEAVTTKLTTAGFHTMKALSTRDVAPEKASCPFDAERDGFVIGEGAGVLMLENWDKAQARGATILAELVSVGCSSDAYHITAPEPHGTGAALAMREALELANLDFSQIDYINTHGTSTPLGDVAETLAIKSVFQDHAYKLALNSTKSMTGHMLGAAAGIESVFCIKTLESGMVAPTINLHHPDPKCDLNYTPNVARKINAQYVLNNSFGFGGTNCCLIFKAPSYN